MVERFFSMPQNDFHSPLPLHGDDENQHRPPILLLSGPPSCGKSSFLFQFAFNSAIHGNSTSSTSSSASSAVVFLCNRRKLETNPPFLSQGIDPSSQVFQRIKMKYVDDDEGIKKYFAGFHLHHAFPVLVVIDDFADFFDQRNCQEKHSNPRGRDLAMVRVLALCQNAITHANAAGVACGLLLSDTHHGDSPRLLYIYKRWVSSIYTIQGDGFGSFLLKNSYHSGSAASLAPMKLAKYSIAVQHLVLEGITEDDGQ